MYPNWFEPYARPLFEKHLTPLAGKPGLRFLQIGAFTGDASVWLLENVLTGEGSTLTDVDTWRGSAEPEHRPFDWADVEDTYDQRTAGFVGLVKCKTTSARFFKNSRDRFDLIYIDGDHDPLRVFADGLSALRLLKPGGLLAFDDYEWMPHGGGQGPGYAVDKLYSTRADQLTILHMGAQAWFQS